MKKRRLTPLVLSLTWASWLLVYLPTACTPSSAGIHAESTSQVDARTSGGLAETALGLIPQPAFASASQSVSNARDRMSIADVAEAVSPSVVSVFSRRARPQRRRRSSFGLPGGPRDRNRRSAQGLGSGIIVSKDGLILTNNHVIEDADEITVEVGSQQYEALVIGSDAKSDVAILRLQGDISGLKPIKYGDSSRLRVGEVVLAIGNPFGVGKTVTMGIVSAKGRTEVGIVDYADFIQTDAAINPGNSGGALVNMQGELVGINTAIFSKSGGYQGIGFAIPSNMARPISESLLQHGRVSRGYLGIEIQNLNANLQSALELPSSNGVLISNVRADQAGAQGGLKQGDVIWSVNGAATESVNQLRNAVATAGANKEVVLELTRSGKRKTLKLTLGELESKEKTSSETAETKTQKFGGLSVETLKPLLRRRLPRLPKHVQAGVVVVGVEPESKAARSGLKPGDVIVQADGTPLRTSSEFRALQKKGAKSHTSVLLYRRGRSLYLALER